MSDLIEYKLCNQNDMDDNSMKEFEIDIGTQDQKIKVLLIKQNNSFYCLASKCSHYQVPLVNGVLIKDRLRCFAHGACFNIKTGDIEDYPGPDCIPKYEVFVDNLNNVYLRATIQELLTQRRIKPVKTIERQQLDQNNQSRPFSSNITFADKYRKSLTTIIPKCLIIGSGAAGLLCLDTLREAGFSSNITMITQDGYLPYDRPKLSKALNLKINSIALRDEDYFRSNDINFETNQVVERIDFEKKRVHAKSGKVFDYDRLVIATGLESVKSQPKPGYELKGIFTLRSLDDAQNIINYFEQINNGKKLNIILVGGSFISLEVASYFADKSNTVVMARRKPFETGFGTQVSNKIQKLHESKGVKFFINNKFDIAEYKESSEKQGNLGSIKLNDGSEHMADICLLAIGGKPATEFLKNSPIKLTLENYVYVDKQMRTNIENVYAAGDIIFFPKACMPGYDFILSKHNKKLDHVNIAHWGLASSQGRVAGLSIVSESLNHDLNNTEHSFNCVPFFWSAQHGKNIRFSGYNEQYDAVVFHEDPTKQNELKFAAFYIYKERVVAVCTLDWDPLCALYAEAMFNKIEVKRQHIENDPNNLGKLLE